MKENQQTTSEEDYLQENMTNEEIRDLLLMMINLILGGSEKEFHISDN